MGIVGHDLRSPLSAILLSTTLLQEAEELTDRQARLVSMIQRSAARIESLTRDLLDFTRTRWELGIPVTPRTVDLDTICRAAIEEVESGSPGRVVDYASSGDGHGEWDPRRLAQLLANLLGNALTHGDPAASVVLRWHGEAEQVLLQVENRGPPIPPEHLPGLFEPFNRLSASRGDRGGIGLGLFIAREIARAHGGDIQVSSNSLGTVVSTRLPRRDGKSAGAVRQA